MIHHLQIAKYWTAGLWRLLGDLSYLGRVREGASVVLESPVSTERRKQSQAEPQVTRDFSFSSWW